MFTAARNKELPVAYISSRVRGTAFAGRKTSSGLWKPNSFYGRVLGFEPDEVIEPVEIENL